MNVQTKNAPKAKSLIQLYDDIQSHSQKGEYPSPDIRGPIPQNAHPDATFSSGTHNDWTHAQTDPNLIPAYEGEPIHDQRFYGFEDYGDYVQTQYTDQWW